MGEIVRWRITSTWIDGGLLAMIHVSFLCANPHPVGFSFYSVYIL